MQRYGFRVRSISLAVALPERFIYSKISSRAGNFSNRKSDRIHNAAGTNAYLRRHDSRGLMTGRAVRTYLLLK
jgi:hypothetical protein